MMEITETEPGQIFLFCRKPGHEKEICFNLKKKEAQNVHASNFKGISDQRNCKSKDVVLTVTSKNKFLMDDIWICVSGACGHYCKSDKGLFNVDNINEKITVGHSERMKIGSLKSILFNLTV
jgi:hypothetical protein